MTEFHKFPSIERFHHVVKGFRARPNLYPQKIIYRGKLKLHGTNAAIGFKRTKRGLIEVWAQKRSGLVTIDADNKGFAAWVARNEQALINQVDRLTFGENDTFIVHGEWAGPGIQKGVAISQAPHKFFAIFAVEKDGKMYTDPANIGKYFRGYYGQEKLLDDVFILPTVMEVHVDLKDAARLKQIAEQINEHVDAIDERDNWAGRTFGVDGPGEGLVFYPVSEADKDGGIDREVFSRLTFKAKGRKHEVVKTDKKAVELSPEEIATQNHFVEMFVTDNRLEQIAQQALDGNFDIKQTGTFLKAFGQDVHKESQAELAANDIEWKDVAKAVTVAARQWFVQKCREV